MTKKSLLLTIGLIVLSLVVFVIKLILTSPPENSYVGQEEHVWWEIQSIDTVKYSRDVARQMGSDASFDAIIEEHVASIASTGATHVALGTPYDEEFVPFLARWVSVARKYDLNVWFRSHWAEWEGDEGLSATMSSEEYLVRTKQFILENPEMFVVGDAFTVAVEAEQVGVGLGKRFLTWDEYRKFLLAQIAISSEAFSEIGLKGKFTQTGFL